MRVLQTIPDCTLHELAVEDLPALQSFYEVNPLYWQQCLGQAPAPTEAHEDFFGGPPTDWPKTRQWTIGITARESELAGAAGLISDLFIESVWHIGFFMVATRLHGDGSAQRMYAVLEDWMRAQGARWLRLGVVIGNTRAERFWQRRGYLEVRRRPGVEMGRRVNDLRVMVKPLTGAPLDEYLSRVSRDRPDPL